MIKKLIIIIITTLGITNLYSQSFQSQPEWAKSAVWYQIFPERFYNANTANDPDFIDVYEDRPFIIPDDWQIHPWPSDWYKLQEWEKKYNVPFYWATSLRRYGGDLEGIILKLDYLQGLGINAIYLNPIFESQSHHKYNAAMFHHVDDNFGRNPKRDKEIWLSENPEDKSTWKWTSADSVFLLLIEECHKRNIKIIIDGVFNHVGKNFWTFKDVVKKQQMSIYKDWFVIKSFDDSLTAENEFDYSGWYGIKDLPEFYEDKNGFRAEVKKHIFDIVSRWMDPNNDGNPEDGIDGWRLDVAEMVNINFWKEFRKHVKKINPEAYITGEVWWENWKINKMFNAKPWLNGDAFDAVMNYRFARAIKEFFVNKVNKINANAFADTLKNIYNDLGFDICLSLQNLLDSHDVDRIVSQLNNPDIWYDHEGNLEQNKNYNIENISAENKKRLELIVAVQMTLPGAPMIYYGDEAGMWGGDDPDCRKPMIWKEFDYENESHHPFNKSRKTSIVKFDEELFEHYRKLISIRKENFCLTHGKIDFIELHPNVLVFKREIYNNSILVFANNQEKNFSVDLRKLGYDENKKLFDVYNKKFIEENIILAPYDFVIIKFVNDDK